MLSVAFLMDILVLVTSCIALLIFSCVYLLAILLWNMTKWPITASSVPMFVLNIKQFVTQPKH